MENEYFALYHLSYHLGMIVPFQVINIHWNLNNSFFVESAQISTTPFCIEPMQVTKYISTSLNCTLKNPSRLSSPFQLINIHFKWNNFLCANHTSNHSRFCTGPMKVTEYISRSWKFTLKNPSRLPSPFKLINIHFKWNSFLCANRTSNHSRFCTESMQVTNYICSSLKFRLKTTLQMNLLILLMQWLSLCEQVDFSWNV